MYKYVLHPGSGSGVNESDRMERQHAVEVEYSCVATYVPSGRRDSGITRSSVRGSTVMPATVVFGMISGFDIFNFLINGSSWDSYC